MATAALTDYGLQQATRAKRERARRELARRRLIDFCAYVDPGAARLGATDPFVQNAYRARHLQLIATTIEQATDGSLWQGVPGNGVRILLITTPPGHWKTSLVSRKFPPWFIGRQHKAGQPHQVILTSYNATLATTNNRAALDLVKENRLYANVFPDITLSRMMQSSEQWALQGEPFPCCVAAGVGGGLTGHHGDVCIVDDPIKDRAQANSISYMAMLWDWWKDVLRTRVNPGGFILGIWTRWSEDDPAGRIFKAKKKGENDDQVVLVRLPALAETQKERASAARMGLPIDADDPLGRAPGEALWPEREPADKHISTRKSHPVTFDSLYQGRPRPQAGFIAGRELFQVLSAIPKKHVRWVWGTDWAITEKETAPKKRDDPDYTVAALVGLWTPSANRDDARIVIAFIRRGQHNLFEAKKLVKATVRSVNQPRPVYAGQANIDTIAFQDLRRDADLLAYRFRILDRKRMPGDKVARAKTWLEDRLHAGQVYVLQGGWNEAFFNEVEQFPHGVHDDQVDAVSVAVHALGMGGSRRAGSKQLPGFGGVGRGW